MVNVMCKWTKMGEGLGLAQGMYPRKMTRTFLFSLAGCVFWDKHRNLSETRQLPTKSGDIIDRVSWETWKVLMMQLIEEAWHTAWHF